MALTKTTQDHNEVRRWAEERGARPAAVSATETDDRTGIIRLEFLGAPKAKDKALEEISWDEWFDKFDANGLEFTYQEKTAAGEKSNFNKLTYPENEKGSSSHGSGGSRAGKKSGSTKSSRAASSAKSIGRTAGPASGRGSSNRTTARASSTGGAAKKRSAKAR